MLCKAVIFDFNGTLFYDTEFHNQAWQQFANRYGKIISQEALELNIHGYTNREIIRFLFDRDLSIDEYSIYYEEKEEIYRTICAEHPGKCILSPGSEDFLNKLKAKNIPHAIATASYLRNVEMYFTMFDLGRWFTMEQFVFDSGEYRGKPHPDMFLAAADKLDTPISECLVIEDSLGGVQAAKNAGAARIVAVSSDNNPGKFSQFDFIDQIITDFRQIDFNL
jgi:beta-phosphoglucomutase